MAAKFPDIDFSDEGVEAVLRGFFVSAYRKSGKEMTQQKTTFAWFSLVYYWVPSSCEHSLRSDEAIQPEKKKI